MGVANLSSLLLCAAVWGHNDDTLQSLLQSVDVTRRMIDGVARDMENADSEYETAFKSWKSKSVHWKDALSAMFAAGAKWSDLFNHKLELERELASILASLDALQTTPPPITSAPPKTTTPPVTQETTTSSTSTPGPTTPAVTPKTTTPPVTQETTTSSTSTSTAMSVSSSATSASSRDQWIIWLTFAIAMVCIIATLGVACWIRRRRGAKDARARADEESKDQDVEDPQVEARGQDKSEGDMFAHV